jgi:hypothetical protein
VYRDKLSVSLCVFRAPLQGLVGTTQFNATLSVPQDRNFPHPMNHHASEKARCEIQRHRSGSATIAEKDLFHQTTVQFRCTQSKQQPLCRYRMQHQNKPFACVQRQDLVLETTSSSLPVPVFFSFLCSNSQVFEGVNNERKGSGISIGRVHYYHSNQINRATVGRRQVTACRRLVVMENLPIDLPR